MTLTAQHSNTRPRRRKEDIGMRRIAEFQPLKIQDYFDGRTAKTKRRRTRKMMYSSTPLVLIVSLFLVWFYKAEASTRECTGSNLDAGEKLRVGIKHRPELCERRSKKGDLLSMHYEGASTLLYTTNSQQPMMVLSILFFQGNCIVIVRHSIAHVRGILLSHLLLAVDR